MKLKQKLFRLLYNFIHAHEIIEREERKRLHPKTLIHSLPERKPKDYYKTFCRPYIPKILWIYDDITELWFAYEGNTQIKVENLKVKKNLKKDLTF